MRTIRYFLCSFYFFIVTQTTNGQGVGIGTTTVEPSAILEIKASNKGILIPKTSTVGRTSIVKPAKGLMVYDTTSGGFWFYQDTSWVNLSINTNSLGIPTLADYDGDKKADLSVYYPAEKKWVVRQSLNGSTITYVFNITTANVLPVPADYDGDAKADMILYDTSKKRWIIRKSSDATILMIDF